MAKEKTRLCLRLNEINEARNHILEETNHNGLMSKNHQKVCEALNFFEHFLGWFLLSVVVFQFVSAFASLFGVLVSILSSGVGLKLVQSMQELKILTQLSRKEEKA